MFVRLFLRDAARDIVTPTEDEDPTVLDDEVVGYTAAGYGTTEGLVALQGVSGQYSREGNQTRLRRRVDDHGLTLFVPLANIATLEVYEDPADDATTEELRAALLASRPLAEVGPDGWVADGVIGADDDAKE